jgi:uncharacterized protein (DUF849 family)
LTSPNRLLQAALNGDRDKAAHPATPVFVEELERDASACVAAGARAIHMHPRDPEGRQTLEAGAVLACDAGVRHSVEGLGEAVCLLNVATGSERRELG